MISRLIVVLAAVLLATGCRNRPLVTLMRGDMNMNGQMQMAGDMTMRGNMNMTGDVATSMRTDNTASRLVSVPVYSNSGTGTGRICVIDVDGWLVNRNLSGLGSMGENPVALFREKLDAIAADSTIRAVVLRINSGGGGVTASDMMSRDLEQLVSQRDLPVVACLMEVGAGGAYYLAAGADAVIAHPTALVGGIGVILNVYNLEDMLGQFGITPIPVKSGDRVDMGSPNRVMSEEERAALQSIADQFHQRFIERIRQRRNLSTGSQELFDGRVLTGTQAQVAGLVDRVGYLDDAIQEARSLAGLAEGATVVMLRRDNDRAYTALDMSPNTPTLSSLIPLKVPGLDRSALPTFLYLWQPEPAPY
ncbi:MAG: signal peptide peptidase SppA [Pirellulaceae bacterium]|nr:signal peptide peptidase SppA [Pirellulaceae bacterium]